MLIQSRCGATNISPQKPQVPGIVMNLETFIAMMTSSYELNILQREVCLFVCLFTSICLFVLFIPIQQDISLFVCFEFFLPLQRDVGLFVCQFLCLFVCLFWVCPPNPAGDLFVCFDFSLPIQRDVCLFVCFGFFLQLQRDVCLLVLGFSSQSSGAFVICLFWVFRPNPVGRLFVCFRGFPPTQAGRLFVCFGLVDLATLAGR